METVHAETDGPTLMVGSLIGMLGSAPLRGTRVTVCDQIKITGWLFYACTRKASGSGTSIRDFFDSPLRFGSGKGRGQGRPNQNKKQNREGHDIGSTQISDSVVENQLTRLGAALP